MKILPDSEPVTFSMCTLSVGMENKGSGNKCISPMAEVSIPAENRNSNNRTFTKLQARRDENLTLLSYRHMVG